MLIFKLSINDTFLSLLHICYALDDPTKPSPTQSKMNNHPTGPNEMQNKIIPSPHMTAAPMPHMPMAGAPMMPPPMPPMMGPRPGMPMVSIPLIKYKMLYPIMCACL